MSEYVCDLPIDGMASFVSGTMTIPVREEVVRCRDCRWFMPYSNATYCDRFASAFPAVEPDDFCAWGERKEAE